MKDLLVAQSLIDDSIKATPVKGKYTKTIDLMSPEETDKDINLGNNAGAQSHPKETGISPFAKKVVVEESKEKEVKH